MPTCVGHELGAQSPTATHGFYSIVKHKCGWEYDRNGTVIRTVTAVRSQGLATLEFWLPIRGLYFVG